MDLKLLLKRGALLAAANWPTVAIQFLAETTFQVLLAVPLIGAAILVAVLMGTDIAELLPVKDRLIGAISLGEVPKIFAAAVMILGSDLTFDACQRVQLRRTASGSQAGGVRHSYRRWSFVLGRWPLAVRMCRRPLIDQSD